MRALKQAAPNGLVKVLAPLEDVPLRAETAALLRKALENEERAEFTDLYQEYKAAGTAALEEYFLEDMKKVF